MTKNLHTFYAIAVILLSVILGALLDRIHADLSKKEDNKPEVAKMRLEMLNNGKVHSYPLDNVNYKLVKDEK